MDNRIGSKSITYLLYLLLFMFSFGVGNFEKYFLLVIFGIYLYIVFYCAKGHLCIYRKSPVVPLAFWGLLYLLMFSLDGNDVISGLFYYLVGPVLFWLIGRDISTENDEKANLGIILMVSTGLLLHGIVNIGASISGGYFKYNAEYILDVWSGRTVSRTIVGMYMTPFVCAAIPLVFLWEKTLNIFIRIGLVIGVVIALASTVYVGNRSLLIITAVSLLFSVLYGMKVSRQKAKTLIGIILGVFLVSIVVISSLDEISNFVANSFLGKRNVSFLDDGRWSAYRYVFTNFFDYIFGWISSRTGVAGVGLAWAHNIWIDVFIYAGIIPALIFLVFSIKVLANNMKILKRNSFWGSSRLIALIMTIGVFLNWAVEPVLDANPYFFALCCFVFGAFEKWCKVSNPMSRKGH